MRNQTNIGKTTKYKNVTFGMKTESIFQNHSKFHFIKLNKNRCFGFWNEKRFSNILNRIFYT